MSKRRLVDSTPTPDGEFDVGVRIQQKSKAYSKYSDHEVEERLNISIIEIFNKQRPVESVIGTIKSVDQLLKDKIYDILVDFIYVEDFPTGALSVIKEASICDMVVSVLIPIIAYFKKKENKSNIKLRRERSILSVDSKSHGNEEFVIMDTIESEGKGKEIYVMIVEGKRDNVDKSFNQCALALKDAYDNNNDNKTIYGFLTTGISWKLLKYDGKEFSISEDFFLAFALMNEDKERWMKDFSKTVDVIYQTLYHH